MINNAAINRFDMLGLAWFSDVTRLFKQRGGIDANLGSSSNSALFPDGLIASVTVVVMPECDKDGKLSGKWTIKSAVDASAGATYENMSQLDGVTGSLPGDIQLALAFSTNNRIHGMIDGAWQGGLLGGAYGGVTTLPAGGAGAVPGAVGGAITGGIGGAIWGAERTVLMQKNISTICACKENGLWVPQSKSAVIRKKTAGAYYWE